MNNKDDSPKTSLERLLGQDTDRGGQRRDPSFSNFADHQEEDYEEPDRDTDFDAGYQSDNVDDDESFDDEPLPAAEVEPVFAAADTDVRYDADPADDHDDHDHDDEDDEDEEEDDPDDWLEEDESDTAEQAQGRHWPAGLIAVAVVALVLLAAGGYGVMQQRAATEAELQQLRASLATSASPEEARSSRGALQELQRSYDKLLADSQALTLENRRLADTVAGLEAQLGVQQSALSKAAPAAAKPAAAPSGNSGTASAQPDAERFAPLHSNQSATKPAPQPDPKTAQPTQTSTAAPAVAAPQTSAPTAKAPPAEAPKVKALPAMAPPAKPAATAVAATPAASTGSGPWFVNFGSYATRSMAESWATKLHPGAGSVIIVPNDSAGKTLYRLRVVGLADRDTAKAVAHKLETELRVAQLWVGKE